MPPPESDVVEKEPPNQVPPADHCTPRGIYTPTKAYPRRIEKVGIAQANYNGTGSTMKSWFKSQTGGEVSIGISGELKVSATVLIASLEGKYGLDLSAKLNVWIGNETSVDTRPYKTIHAQYGVWRQVHTGTSYYIYSNCSTSPKKTVASYTPQEVGWYLWET